MSASCDIAAVARGAAGGDSRAWDELVRRFDPTLRTVARGFRLGRTDVDDVLQNVWLRAFRALGTLQEPAAVGGWLVVMTRRESLRALQRGVNELVTDDHARFDRPVLTTPETELLARERVAALRAAIAALPAHQRRVVGTMLAVPGASYERGGRRPRRPGRIARPDSRTRTAAPTPRSGTLVRGVVMSIGPKGADSLALDSLVLNSRVDPEDLRDAWRAACDDVHSAYDAWRSASTAETADRYCGFVAAVDREEAAAAALQSRLQPALAGCGSFRLDATQRCFEHHDGQ